MVYLVRLRSGLAWAAVLWVAVLASLTASRVPVWRSDVALWTDATQVAPQKVRPWVNLAVADAAVGDRLGAAHANLQAVAVSWDARHHAVVRVWGRADANVNLARLLADDRPLEAQWLLTQVEHEWPNFPAAVYLRAEFAERDGDCLTAQHLATIARQGDIELPPLDGCATPLP